MDAKAEKVALFRFGLIAPLVLEVLPRGELTRRAQEIASRLYDIPDSKRRTVSVETLREWALRYRSGRFEALSPKPRQDRGQSLVKTSSAERFGLSSKSLLSGIGRQALGRRDSRSRSARL